MSNSPFPDPHLNTAPHDRSGSFPTPTAAATPTAAVTPTATANPAPSHSEAGGVATLERPELVDLTLFDEPTQTTTPPTPVHPAVTLALVAVVLYLAISSGQLLTLAVVGALAGMIFLHELGHFLTARLTGTKATEFFVGFGPRLWSFRRGETEYGIKAIPLGGYVKILGMTNLDTVPAADEARTYRQATYPRRVLMASAGTLMHLLLAFCLFLTLFAGPGRQETDGPALLNVVAGSQAAIAGLRSGDRVVSMDGQKVNNWEQFRSAVVDSNSNTDRPIPISVGVVRNGALLTRTVTPKLVGDQILIGVQLRPLTRSVPAAVGASAKQIVKLVPQTFVSLGQFFAPSNLKAYSKNIVAPPTTQKGKDEAARNRMLSPIGATHLLESAARSDVRLFLEIFASINVFVGMFNMLPILPLDGGHVLIATYERLRSRPRRGVRYRVNVKHWLPVTYVVMAVMLLLSFSSLYLDVRNPLNIF